MATIARNLRTYSAAEYWSDAAVHGLGIVAALVAVPTLVTLASVWSGEASIVSAAAIYGGCFLAMLVASALNNMAYGSAWQGWLRRIDRSAIYLKIAATYTPLAVLTGSQPGLFLASVWGTALAGVSLSAFHPDRVKWVGLALYLALGWAGVLVGGPMLGALEPAALVLVATGGGLYTLGVVFFLWQRLPFHTTIWHLFVLAASFVFYAAILTELAGRAPQL